MMLWLPLIALQVALIGPLSEELGWRGYALDALQARWSAAASSLVVGLAWSLWHLPLFFIQDETNFYYEFSFVYPIPESVHLYGTVLTLVLAIVIIAIWGPQTLARRGSWASQTRGHIATWWKEQTP